MKTTQAHLLPAAILAALCATTSFADVPAPDPAKVLKDLRADALKLARDKKADIASVSNAYAKVFAFEGLTADDRASALGEIADGYQARGNLAAAIAAAREAFALQGLTDAARAASKLSGKLCASAKQNRDANFKGGFASYRNDGLNAAVRLYREALELPGLPPRERVNIACSLAWAQLDLDGDMEAANRILADAVKVPGLKGRDLVAAKLNLAGALKTEGDVEKALPIYRDIASVPPPETHIHDYNAAVRGIIDCHKAINGAEATYKALKDGELKAFAGHDAFYSFCRENGHYEEGIAPQVAGLSRPDGKDHTYAFGQLLGRYTDRPFPEFKEAMDKYLPLFRRNPGSTNTLKKAIQSIGLFKSKLCSQDERFLPWLVELTKDWPADQRLSDVELFQIALLAPHGEAKFKELARTAPAVLKDEKTKPGLKRSAALFQAAYAARDNGGQAVAKALAAIKDVPATNASARASLLRESARYSMMLGNQAAARAVFTERQKLISDPGQRKIDCPYVENAPQDIASILASAEYKNAKKGLLDVKYGENLQFLIETDANLTGRQMADKTSSKHTLFYPFCDKQGVKFLFYAYSDKMENFENGFGGPGGYEFYFAAGADAPYKCLLINPRGKPDEFDTQYPNDTGYRIPRILDGSAEVTQLACKDGLATLVSFPWKNFFAQLPEEGDEWYVDAIHWANGGMSWGGEKSVHGRSRYGAVVFRGLTPAHVTEIKRRLLPDCRSVYNNSFSSRVNGYGERWSDPDLGDQEFYDAEVAPLRKRLDAYASRVKPGMTDEDVNEVFDNAAVEWMNIYYVIARLRREYLERKLIGE